MDPDTNASYPWNSAFKRTRPALYYAAPLAKHCFENKVHFVPVCTSYQKQKRVHRALRSKKASRFILSPDKVSVIMEEVPKIDVYPACWRNRGQLLLHAVLTTSTVSTPPFALAQCLLGL